jgi:Fe-S cluster assembly iron-binding protein IscA
MELLISKQAERYIQQKLDFFRSRNRVPKIVLTERSCRGANFRLFFDVRAEDDVECIAGTHKVYVSQKLLSEFGGFSLDLEHFFFANRILIQPQKQDFGCECDSKCNK